LSTHYLNVVALPSQLNAVFSMCNPEKRSYPDSRLKGGSRIATRLTTVHTMYRNGRRKYLFDWSRLRKYL